MDYTCLGNTGMKISKIVLGTMQFGWRIEEEESFSLMDKALELGINCFDTADIYSRWGENSYAGKTEEIIGRWMKDRGSRNDLILATKLRGPMSEDINDQGLSRRHIHQAITGSLKRLQTDWVDLYQIHSFDNDTPIEETLHGLNLQVEQGKVNYIGASNIHPWQMVESFWQSEKNGYVKFESLQPVYNLARRLQLEHQFEIVIKKYNIGVIPYSPLAAGFLTGKYSREKAPDTPRSKSVEMRYYSEKRWQILDKVIEVAKELDVKMSQVALAWMLTRDFVTAPIIGANSVEQLEENVDAIDVKLGEDNIKQLDEVSEWIPDFEKIR